MTIKKQRGRKRAGYIYTGDNELFEKQIEKIIALKEEKEAFLNAFKDIIGKYLHRARNGVGISLEELGIKIGVNASQLHKYETADTSISTSRFFLAILYLFNHRPVKFIEDFFQSLTKDIQKSFNEKNIDFNNNIRYVNPDEKTNKLKMHIQEEVLKLDKNELKNILYILKLINKNKENSSNNIVTEEI
jgi:transcriptional regulator with XRE-family HTH domain